MQAAQYASHMTEEAERAKAAKHKAHCTAMGNGYCTVAMTSYGGIGREFRKDWVEPYFKKARAGEIAEGGTCTGFKAVEAKQRFLDDMSLRIARGNAGMVLAATVAK